MSYINKYIINKYIDQINFLIYYWIIVNFSHFIMDNTLSHTQAMEQRSEKSFVTLVFRAIFLNNKTIERVEKEGLEELCSRVIDVIVNSQCNDDKISYYYNKEKYKYIIQDILIIYYKDAHNKSINKYNNSKPEHLSTIIFGLQLLIIISKDNCKFNVEIPDDIIQHIFNIICIALSQHNENDSFSDALFAFRNFILSMIYRKFCKEFPQDIVKQVIKLANREMQKCRFFYPLDYIYPIKEFIQILYQNLKIPIPNNFADGFNEEERLILEKVLQKDTNGKINLTFESCQGNINNKLK